MSAGGEQYENSGLRRFGTPQNYQPYNPGQFSAPTFQAPQLAPRQRFNPWQPPTPATGGLLDGSYGGGGPNVGDPSSSPVSPDATVGTVGGLAQAVLGVSQALQGNPLGLLGMISQSGSGGSSAPSSVGVGAAPGTPGGIGTAVDGGGIGDSGVGSSVGVGAAEGTPGGIGGIGGDGSEGDGGGGGGGGK